MSLPRVRPLLSVLMLVSVGTLTACGSDDPTGLGVVGTGSVSAFVDGQAWAATVAQASNSNGIVGVGASNAAGEGIGFAIEASAPGTFTIASGSVHNGNYNGGGSSWLAGGSNGSGSFVITTLTSTRVTGTFSFEAVSLTGGTPGMRSITQGMFDVTF